MPLAAKPELVNVDANKKTLWMKVDNKPVADFAYQYAHAPLYVDRREAVGAAANEQTTNAAARNVLLAGLADKFYGIRIASLQALKLDDKAVAKAVAATLRKRTTIEKDPLVLPTLLNTMAQLKDKKDEKFFVQQLNSPSYNVQGAALRAFATVQPAQAIVRAKVYENELHGALTQAVAEVYANNGNQAQWAYVRDKFDAARPDGKFGMMKPLAIMLGRLDDTTAFAEGVTRLKDLAIKYKTYGADKPVLDLLQTTAKSQAGRAHAAENQQLVEKAVTEIQAAK